MDKYYKLSDDAISTFTEIFNKKAFPIKIDILFIGDSKQKNLIKISKVSDVYRFVTEMELMVSINEDLLSVFDDTAIQILIEQELDKVNINIDKGTIKLTRPDLITFSGIVNKFGIEEVARANQVEELYNQQVEDGAEDLI